MTQRIIKLDIKDIEILNGRFTNHQVIVNKINEIIDLLSPNQEDI